MRPRLLALAMIAGLVGGGSPARDASAGATVDLLFVGVNGAPIAPTDTVTATAGTVLTMAVLLRNDQSLIAATFSLQYDLDGDNELDVVSAFAWQGFGGVIGPFFQPPPLLPPTPTSIGPFGGLAGLPAPLPLPPAGGAFAGGYQMGTVVWTLTANVNEDGPDILSGFFNPQEACVDLFGNNCDDQVMLNWARVQVIPEPSAALLLAAGLTALAIRRRSARVVT
jgi:hypothetical protein